MSLPSCDQYSLAICVYEWLAGYPPFRAEEKARLLDQQCFASPPSLCVQVPDLPQAVEAVVFRALAKKAEERFPSVGAFAEALARAAVTVPTQVAVPPQENVPSLPDPETLVTFHIWNVPYARNPLFTGRDALLDRLHALLRVKDSPSRMVALSGLGESARRRRR